MTRRGAVVLAVIVGAVVTAWFAVATPPAPAGPTYVCVDSGAEWLDCYRYGDAPADAPIVYVGPRDGIPR